MCCIVCNTPLRAHERIRCSPCETEVKRSLRGPYRSVQSLGFMSIEEALSWWEAHEIEKSERLMRRVADLVAEGVVRRLLEQTPTERNLEAGPF